MPKWLPNWTARSGSRRAPESRRALAAVLAGLVRGYQLVLRPLLPASCRFVPSCSEYAREALGRHGAARGVVLTARRLARCHPWHEGGWDPVPLEKT